MFAVKFALCFIVISQWRYHLQSEQIHPQNLKHSMSTSLHIQGFRKKNDEHGNLFDSLITSMGLILSLFSRSPIYCQYSNVKVRHAYITCIKLLGICTFATMNKTRTLLCRWNSVRRCSLDIFRSFETLGGIYWLRKLDSSINKIETYQNVLLVLRIFFELRESLHEKGNPGIPSRENLALVQ